MTTSSVKVAAVIPAHMASVRFPGKMLLDIHGLPMLEHVRRRALLSRRLSQVLVATCDSEISEAIRGFGGEVVMTSNRHANGTSRVAEVLQNLDCTHVLLLQGDEPLLLPRHLDDVIASIDARPFGDAWNAIGPIIRDDELDRHSFVKCVISEAGRILYCFRRSPCFSEYSEQKEVIKKILGIIAYRKEFLLKLVELEPSSVEKVEYIEQMRIIQNDYSLQSVIVEPSLPSINEPHEADIVLDFLQSNREQQELLARIKY